MTDLAEANKTCDERIDAHMAGRLETLRNLLETYKEDPDAYNEEEETKLDEFGLSFDYVLPDTFEDQPRGYFRYQLSYGGPSDELRIYAERANRYAWRVGSVEYVFMDWFDGAKRQLTGDDKALIDELIAYFWSDELLTYIHEEALKDASAPF